MPEPVIPKLAKWPFFAADALLLAAAYFIYAQGKLPLGPAEVSLATCCVVVGALVSILPFVLEYRAATKVAEASGLTTVVSQLEELEGIAERISGATSRWQNAQDAADKTAAAAKEIAERMTAEVKAFTDFMQRVNDSEKSTLRLEVDKLRRGESDWLHVLVRMLDHVYALLTGAVRSGQPNLIEQMTHFQNACRDAARRVGLAPFVASPEEPFDSQRHQVAEGDSTPPPGAKVSETIATGYTFQGRLLRPALVRLATERSPESEAAPELAKDKQAEPQ